LKPLQGVSGKVKGLEKICTPIGQGRKFSCLESGKRGEKCNKRKKGKEKEDGETRPQTRKRPEKRWS